MDDNKLLKQIDELIIKNLSPIKQDLSGVKKDLRGVKQQLNNVEIKVELVNKRAVLIEGKIDQRQEETIDSLSELIHEGYNQHEKRIKKLEKHLQPPQAQ